MGPKLREGERGICREPTCEIIPRPLSLCQSQPQPLRVGGLKAISWRLCQRGPHLYDAATAHIEANFHEVAGNTAIHHCKLEAATCGFWHGIRKTVFAWRACPEKPLQSTVNVQDV